MTTQRLMMQVINDFKEPVSTKYIAAKNNIGIGVATRIFDHVTYVKSKKSSINLWTARIMMKL